MYESGRRPATSPTSTSQFSPLPSKNIPSQNPSHINFESSSLWNDADIITNSSKGKVFKAKIDVEPISLKKAASVDGIPSVKWTEQEVNRMNIIENL